MLIVFSGYFDFHLEFYRAIKIARCSAYKSMLAKWDAFVLYHRNASTVDVLTNFNLSFFVKTNG